MTIAIEVQELGKDFYGRRAVDKLDFQVRTGEILGLLGPNGAGKTTLIHMLLGLLIPTRGSIRIFGLGMPEHRQEILARVNFTSAYVQMPLSLTPRQNLKVFARLYGVSNPNRKIEELLRRMEIADHSDRPTRGLSSGQISRLSLAKSLLNDPEILFLDEPTSSMDPDIADKTRAILRDVHREQGMTLVYTSHNMLEIESMATRVLFLNEGSVVAEGSPADLARQFGEDTLEKVFLKITRQ